MAISAVPFALQNGSHTAALFRQAVSSIVPNTGGITTSTDLAVTQTGTPSMAVVVGVGRAWVPGTNTANFTGFTYSSQALYFALNDANVTLTIAAADPTNPRIDIVCLTVNDSQYSGGTNNAVLQVITGTPNASPVAPTAPANSLVLANVAVAANATSIVTANITIPAITVILGSIPTRGVFNTTDTNWSWNGGIMKTVVSSALTQFTASAAMNRAAGGSFTVSTSDTNMGNFVPSGYRPAVTAYLVVSVTNGGAVVGQAQLAITTTGDFILRTFSGSFTFPSAGSMYINGSWMG